MHCSPSCSPLTQLAKQFVEMGLMLRRNLFAFCLELGIGQLRRIHLIFFHKVLLSIELILKKRKFFRRQVRHRFALHSAVSARSLGAFGFQRKAGRFRPFFQETGIKTPFIVFHQGRKINPAQKYAGFIHLFIFRLVNYKAVLRHSIRNCQFL